MRRFSLRYLTNLKSAINSSFNDVVTITQLDENKKGISKKKKRQLFQLEESFIKQLFDPYFEARVKNEFIIKVILLENPINIKYNSKIQEFQENEILQSREGIKIICSKKTVYREINGIHHSLTPLQAIDYVFNNQLKYQTKIPILKKSFSV